MSVTCLMNVRHVDTMKTVHGKMVHWEKNLRTNGPLEKKSPRKKVSGKMFHGKNIHEKKTLEKLFSVKGMLGNLNDFLERLRYIWHQVLPWIHHASGKETELQVVKIEIHDLSVFFLQFSTCFGQFV